MKKSEINVGAGPVSAHRKNKGITLIALIITIIVMLILVAVSIQVALNTGLFESAGKATQRWDTAQEQEQEIAGGKITVDGKVYNSIEDYVAGKEFIDWEAILADANANPDKYLQQAEELGQNVEENTAIGIGTNGKVVNMDLWLYQYALNDYDYYDRDNVISAENGYMLNEGYYDVDGMEYIFSRPGYQGSDLENINIPQYIKSGTDTEFLAVTSLPYTFFNLDIEKTPEIPISVEDLWFTFRGCTKLLDVPELSNNVIYMRCTFYECSSLINAPEIPNNVVNFWRCV